MTLFDFIKSCAEDFGIKDMPKPPKGKHKFIYFVLWVKYIVFGDLRRWVFGKRYVVRVGFAFGSFYYTLKFSRKRQINWYLKKLYELEYPVCSVSVFNQYKKEGVYERVQKKDGGYYRCE